MTTTEKNAALALIETHIDERCAQIERSTGGRVKRSPMVRSACCGAAEKEESSKMGLTESKEYYATLSLAVIALTADGFTMDWHDPQYNWRSRSGLVDARVRKSDRGYWIEYRA